MCCWALLLEVLLFDAPSGVGSSDRSDFVIFFDRHSSSTADDILSSKQRWNLLYISFESLEQGEQLLLQVGL